MPHQRTDGFIYATLVLAVRSLNFQNLSAMPTRHSPYPHQSGPEP
jgi:hypothetical protein